MAVCRGGVSAWVGAWVGGEVPSTCSPSKSLLAATFNTALFTGALAGWRHKLLSALNMYG